MNTLFDFPIKSYFGRDVPKSKIYQNASPSSRVRKLFVDQVEKIIWSYKLSPETVNLPAKRNVEEINVFTITLRTGELKHDVLAAIDKAVASPLLFRISFQHNERYVAAYKRQSEADNSKWVVSRYFKSEWIDENAQKTGLPLALDLQSLYHQMLLKLLPLTQQKSETFQNLVDRVDRLNSLERELQALEKRLHKQVQFNRKVALHAEAKTLKERIRQLKDPN